MLTRDVMTTPPVTVPPRHSGRRRRRSVGPARIQLQLPSSTNTSASISIVS